MGYDVGMSGLSREQQRELMSDLFETVQFLPDGVPLRRDEHGLPVVEADPDDPDDDYEKPSRAVTASAGRDGVDAARHAEELFAELDDDVSDEDMQALADLAAEEGLDEDAFVSRMPAQLQKSYLVGKVAQRIQWRTPGDFTRCVVQAKAHGMGRKAEGACATLHRKATGVWPGDRRNR